MSVSSEIIWTHLSLNKCGKYRYKQHRKQLLEEGKKVGYAKGSVDFYLKEDGIDVFFPLYFEISLEISCKINIRGFLKVKRSR